MELRGLDLQLGFRSLEVLGLMFSQCNSELGELLFESIDFCDLIKLQYEAPDASRTLDSMSFVASSSEC